jgi:subtilisin family serine protease
MDCKERILSNNYVDIITDLPVRLGTDDGVDLCYVSVDDQFGVAYVNRLNIPPLPENLYDYQNMPKLYGLMQIEGGNPVDGVGIPFSEPFEPGSLEASGITQVQRRPLNLTGRGVVVCFLDTGIDYTSDVFRDENGNSRILAIWDQTIQDGTPPEGFLYGTEYTREDINLALQSEDPYSVVASRDENGHGSAMASVTAGSRIDGGRTFLGAVPDAEIVVVKLKECKPYLREYYLVPEGVPAYAENDIMLAVKYADSFALVFRRPVVICIGLGTNMGSHDESSALSIYLNTVSVRRSRAVVVCSGNEGNAAHHYFGSLPRNNDGTENSQDVEIRVTENNIGFFLEFWGNVPDVFNIAIRSPGGETVPPVRLGILQSVTYSFIYEVTRITIDSELVEPSSGEELIILRIQDPTPGIWNFRVTSVGQVNNGGFHMWLPITQFLSSPVSFLAPDPYTTLTTPSVAGSVIGVSTYNDENNSFYIESSRGYTRAGDIRPDFAAPGVNVSTMYGKRSGSSLSAAIAAGGVAQFMQWAVVEGGGGQVESREINNYFRRGAARSRDIVYPNREWGYGRLNMVGTFDAMAEV